MLMSVFLPSSPTLVSLTKEVAWTSITCGTTISATGARIERAWVVGLLTGEAGGETLVDRGLEEGEEGR